MKKAHFVYGLVCFLLSLNVRSQTFEIGTELGYGRTSDESFPFSSVYNFFDASESQYYKIGLIGYYAPSSALFSIKSGITYNLINGNGSWDKIKDLKMVQLPLGCELRIGKKYYCLLGLGMYTITV